MLPLPCECYECLRMLTNGLENVTNVLMNDTNVLPTLTLSCHFLTNNATIWWRGCDWYKYGVNMTLGSLCFQCLTNVTNGLRMLTNIDGEWQYLQHSQKFRRRFLNWPIFVSRGRMTCERSEFVTNAYKYSASVANFEQMSNLLIRKHIPKHIRLRVRAALVKKIPSLP